MQEIYLISEVTDDWNTARGSGGEIAGSSSGEVSDKTIRTAEPPERLNPRAADFFAHNLEADWVAIGESGNVLTCGLDSELETLSRATFESWQQQQGEILYLIGRPDLSGS